MVKSKTGYPSAYFRLRLSEVRNVTVFGVALLLLFFIFSIFMEQVLALVILAIPTIFILFGLALSICSSRQSYIVPYFEKQFPHRSSYGERGSHLLKNLRHIDEYLDSQNTTTLSAFGFTNVLRGKTLKWHDPSELLKSLKEARDKIESIGVSDEPEVLKDLDDLIQLIEAASKHKARVTLLIRSGDYISMHEVDRGVGFF